MKLSDDNYIQLAELVQSLESYSFVNLRIYLLQPKVNKFLVKSLYGILLMIPQGKAYQALYKRLSHMNMIYKLDYDNEIISQEESKLEKANQEDIDYYLKIFEKIHHRKKPKQNSFQHIKFNLENGVENEEDEENIEGFLYESIYENQDEANFNI